MDLFKNSVYSSLSGSFPFESYCLFLLISPPHFLCSLLNSCQTDVELPNLSYMSFNFSFLFFISLFLLYILEYFLNFVF